MATKETFYFSHDYYSRNDPKMVGLFMKTGITGVGIFWCVIEMLYEQGGYLMRTECERIAFELRVDSEIVKSVIESELFKKDDEKFWSESVLRRLNKRHDKSISARKSAILRWENANALQSQSESNANKVKESKVKESKTLLGGLDAKVVGFVVYNAEETVLGNQIEFERICTATGKDLESAKISLRKYHLWLDENEKYPKGKRAIFSGFEKWIMGEKRFNGNSINYTNGATNQSTTGKTFTPDNF